MKRVRNSPQFLIAAALFAIAIVQAARAATLLDPDMWWRLRTGEWMIRNGQIPHVDPFSTYGGSHPWVAYTWLFDLLLYGFYAAGGLAGAAGVPAGAATVSSPVSGRNGEGSLALSTAR